MGVENGATEVPEAAADRTAVQDKKAETVTDNKDKDEEKTNGVEEMDEEKNDGEINDTQEMDVEKEEVKSSKVADEEEEKEENKEDQEEEGPESESMEKETGMQENEDVEAKADEESHDLQEDDGKPGVKKVEKGSKKRVKSKNVKEKISNKKKAAEKKVPEPKTPSLPATERPVRERKSVERLVAVIDKDAVKEFHIEKGQGSALKDIPNVAYKLSKRKTDDTFKLLHTILFGRRGKAFQVKSNISRFSGFVWHGNEDKQKIKVKEKFDKCVKEKLLEFCDLLDIPIAKNTARKEDIVMKLIEFLVAPYATTTELLAEKEQSSKGKKRKRVTKSGASMSESTPSKHSSKSRNKTESVSRKYEKKSDTEDDTAEEDDEEHEEEKINGVAQKSEEEMSEHAESEEKENESEDESEEDAVKHKRVSKRSSTEKESAEKAKTKKATVPKKSSPSPKKTSAKTSSNRLKVDDYMDTSPKTFSRKRKDEGVKEKSTSSKKSEKAEKKVSKGKDKPKEVKLRPSDRELRNAICEILKEVDLNMATFTDILKQLAKRFDTDLTPRKSSIKLMIQDELSKLADEADGEEDEGNAEKEGTQPSAQGVEA